MAALERGEYPRGPVRIGTVVEGEVDVVGSGSAIAALERARLAANQWAHSCAAAGRIRVRRSALGGAAEVRLQGLP